MILTFLCEQHSGSDSTCQSRRCLWLCAASAVLPPAAAALTPCKLLACRLTPRTCCRSATLSGFTDRPQDIAHAAKALLRALNVPHERIRGIGLTVRVTSVLTTCPNQSAHQPL